MTAQRVARKAVRAMRRGSHEIILSPAGKLLVWLDRLSPPMVNRLSSFRLISRRIGFQTVVHCAQCPPR